MLYILNYPNKQFKTELCHEPFKCTNPQIIVEIFDLLFFDALKQEDAYKNETVDLDLMIIPL